MSSASVYDYKAWFIFAPWKEMLYVGRLGILSNLILKLHPRLKSIS